MEEMKKITFRVSKNDHERLRVFATKQGLSVNTLLKKAIQLNFNFKTQDVIKTVPFLTATSSDNSENSAVEKATLYASIEALVILREVAKKEGGDLLRNAKEIAAQKVAELTE